MALAVLIASAKSVFPVWIGPRPTKTINASAGLPVFGSDATHITVYSSNVSGVRNQFGVYNHGPIITEFQGRYWMSWYNAPVGELYDKRSVYATSTDLIHWSEPAVLFPTFAARGEENGPWTTIGVGSAGRLYSQSGTQDAGEHHEGIISVMRRVGIGANATHPGTLGAPFWLNITVPSYCSNLTDCEYPTYLEMDDVTRRDAEQLLASFIRTTVVTPDVGGASSGSVPSAPSAPRAATSSFPTMQYNERSLYMVPGTRTLVLLLRGKAGGLSVSTCKLPHQKTASEQTLFSCRPGIGDAFMNLVEIVADASNASDPRTCNWSAPVMSTLPDSGARTCAGRFPKGSSASAGKHLDGGVYLVGNQIESGRDPVTLALSRDGITFDRHFAIRYTSDGKQKATITNGGACPRWEGHAKGCGFQYPGAMIDVAHQRMIVSYSIGKEDIALTHFPLRAIASTECQHQHQHQTRSH